MPTRTLNKFGTHAGSLVDAVVIAATPVTNNRALITEFGATMEDSGADARFKLQVSRDSFAADIREKSHIVMPVGGSFIKTFTSPVIVQPGESFRVVSNQSVAAEVTSELFGTADNADIMD